MSTSSGNLGEWSELYVLGFLLANGGSFAADSFEQPIPNSFYKVLEIFLSGHATHAVHTFKILDDSVISVSPGGESSVISKEEIKRSLTEFFTELTSGEYSKTFHLPGGERLLKLLRRDRLSAPSSQKAHDLELVMLDRASAQPTPKVGFSIKSQIGQPATLLNASGATNLTFAIDLPSPISREDASQLNSIGLRERLSKIVELGGDLRFLKFDNQQFHQNLLLLDSRMPEYLAGLVKSFYLNKTSTLSDVCETVFPSGDERLQQPRFKVKQFLGAIAMGLRPTQHWDGDITKFKGLILAKLNGDVLFYYLYNISEFQDFLFNSLKFEVASTSRHGFGQIYQQNESLLVKLNLQIRFIR